MSLFKIPGFFFSMLLVLVFSSTIQAAEPFNVNQEKQIEAIVRDYILANPEIIAEAMAALENKRIAAERLAQTNAVTDRADSLFNSEHQAVLGNPDGDVTLVEFFDYNCGFCKRAMGDMFTLIENDPNLRVVLKELPVLGEASLEAARVALAINTMHPDQYVEYHARLLGARGRASGVTAINLAVEMGMDKDTIQLASMTENVNAAIQEVRSLAVALGVSGTPSYVIGDEVVFGAVGYDQLKEKILQARACGGKTTTC